MPPTNFTENNDENDVELILGLLPVIIPIGMIFILLCCICIDQCRINYIMYGCRTQRNLRNTDSGSSLDYSISYPSFLYKPKPKIFFIKDMKQFNLKSKELDNSDCCSICIEEYDIGDKIVKFPCGHEFHKLCVHPWLRQQIDENTTVFCPLCKDELTVEYRLEINENDKGVIIEEV